MTAHRRAQGLAAAARVQRERLLDLGEKIAAGTPVTLVEPPTARSVMLEVQSAVGAACLGEVVVTTCSVTVEGEPGWSCALGWDRSGALAAALADAAGGTEAEELGRRAIEFEAAARRAEDQALAATRVLLG